MGRRRARDVKTNHDHRYGSRVVHDVEPVVVRALVHPGRENDMNDHALYRDRPELEFDAEWWNGHYVAVKERLFPAGSHELIIVEKEFYLFFAPDPATPSCYPQPADLPRASVSNVTRVDFWGRAASFPGFRRATRRCCGQAAAASVGRVARSAHLRRVLARHRHRASRHRRDGGARRRAVATGTD